MGTEREDLHKTAAPRCFYATVAIIIDVIKQAFGTSYNTKNKLFSYQVF